MASRRVRVMLALAIAIAGFTAYLAYRLRIDDLTEQLVLDANQVVGARRLRPTHVDHATPGSFSDALSQHLPAVEAAGKDFPRNNESRGLLSRVIDGERPLSETPPVYLAALEQLRPHIDALLAATHAEAADFAPAEDSFMPASRASWLGLRLTATLAGLRIREVLEAGQTTEAMDLCLDALAFGRDVTLAGGLNGLDASNAAIRRLSRVCVAAIQKQQGAALAQVPARLRRIRDAIPGFDFTMREEALEVQLYLFGPFLSPSQLEQLQARPRMFAKGIGLPPRDDSFWRRFALRTFWRESRELYANMTKAAALRPDRRNAAFKALAETLERKPVWMRDFIPQPQNYLRDAHRADSILARLDLLLVVAAAQAYREKQGSWPKGADALVEAGHITAEESNRAAEAMMTVHLNDKGDLEITLPQPNERGPSEMVVRLAAQ